MMRVPTMSNKHPVASLVYLKFFIKDARNKQYRSQLYMHTLMFISPFFVLPNSIIALDSSHQHFILECISVCIS